MHEYTRLLIALFVLLAVPGLASAQNSADAVGRGGQIYAMVCDNCHNMRLPNEYDPEEWTVIVMHMRTRADLTKSEAESVAAFLREVNNGGESTAVHSPLHDFPGVPGERRSGARMRDVDGGGLGPERTNDDGSDPERKNDGGSP